jgi:hypothetical protein
MSKLLFQRLPSAILQRKKKPSSRNAFKLIHQQRQVIPDTAACHLPTSTSPRSLLSAVPKLPHETP